VYFEHYHSNRNRIRTQETRNNKTQNLDNGDKLSDDFGNLLESDEELSTRASTSQLWCSWFASISNLFWSTNNSNLCTNIYFKYHKWHLYKWPGILKYWLWLVKAVYANIPTLNRTPVPSLFVMLAACKFRVAQLIPSVIELYEATQITPDVT